jgi:hypothetical protein
MSKNVVFVFLLIIVSSCLNSEKKYFSSELNTVTTKKIRYLYEVKYHPKDFPYALWDFPIRGGYDGMHKIISIIPSGYALNIKSANIKRDLYNSGIIKFQGYLLFKGKKYNFTCSCPEAEYSQEFAPN